MHMLPNLPDAITREIFATLCALLPPPAIDTAEARADRAATAMASVATLQPANAFEADLAAHIVGSLAHAKDCLRIAARPGQEPRDADRCRARATALMRQTLGLLRALRGLGPERTKRETVAPASREAPLSQVTPDRVRLTEVETYAATHPDRAARIRAAGGLPKPLDFDPPRHSLVRAIVNSTSPILRALDMEVGLACPPWGEANVPPHASSSHATTL